MSGVGKKKEAPGRGVLFGLPLHLQVNILSRIPILELRRLHKGKVSVTIGVLTTGPRSQKACYDVHLTPNYYTYSNPDLGCVLDVTRPRVLQALGPGIPSHVTIPQP
jgi:hypothetical protein